MNIEINDKYFMSCYNRLFEMNVPREWDIHDVTIDTDIITATDIILGAVWRLNRGEKPEDIKLFEMENFLDSLNRFLISSEKDKSDVIQFRHCREYADLLSVLYHGLLQRKVAPVPIYELQTKRDQLCDLLHTYEKMQYSLHDGQNDLSQLLSPSFKGNAYLTHNGQTICVKCDVVRYDDNYYRANANIDVTQHDSCEDLWRIGIASGESLVTAIENLLGPIVECFSKMSSINDGCFSFNEEEV